MSPYVDHLVVLLEEAKEVVPPVLAGGTVPGVDVRLTEELRHLALFDRARHFGEAILQQPGETAEMLPAEGQRADPLQDGCHLAACGSFEPGSRERRLRALRGGEKEEMLTVIYRGEERAAIPGWDEPWRYRDAGPALRGKGLFLTRQT